MTYKSIMVQLDIDAPATPRTKFAMDLAKRFKADLIGFAAAEAHVFVPRDEGGLVAAEVLRRRTQEIDDGLTKLEEEFVRIAGKGEHVSWRSDIGNPTNLLAIHSRAADLLVIGAPAPGLASDGRRTVDPA